MPPYSYHLKFELYPSSDPATSSSGGAASEEQLWTPKFGSTIFDDLPRHPRKPGLPAAPSIPYSEYAIDLTPKEYEKRPRPGPSPLASSAGGVIDCGAPRAASQDTDDDDSNLVRLSERQWRARSKSFPPPGFAAGIGPRKAVKDWRFGQLSIESFSLGEGADSTMSHSQSDGKMAVGRDAEGTSHAAPAASLGPTLGGAGQATKARYIPLETKNTEIGWGIVHLYREGDDAATWSATPATELGEDEASSAAANGTATDEEDGTILCIPAVPSYLSPSDFLGFVGEKWRGDVSHYRMVMTSHMNRYMVLMKLKDNRLAREWRKEFDGKVFNSMESEICHVTFIKSITFETPNQSKPHKAEKSSDTYASSSKSVVNSLRPFPPPTPSLIELPTCPVCLERMDDTTGLMTILCQHVFHCTCLQTWKGSGCPVCRATNPSPQQDAYDPENPYTQPFGNGVSNFCSVCDTSSDLWICLICGNVGCGRYKGGHAKDHWKETAHSFSLELETQHVWDYAGDMWVHRLIRDKGDGKVVELPSNNNSTSRRRRRGGGGEDDAEEEDVVPRAKLDHIGMEYTHLLTSQLESQRLYFEEMVNKAADKAAKAASAAEAAAEQAQEAMRELALLRAEQSALRKETIPSLERDLERERAKVLKSTELARGLGKSLQEEKKVGEGLMERIGHVNKELEAIQAKMAELQGENEGLKEMNHDLTMFISGQEKLKELESDGKLEAGELEDGTASVPEDKRRGKGKGKAKR